MGCVTVEPYASSRKCRIYSDYASLYDKTFGRSSIAV